MKSLRRNLGNEQNLIIESEQLESEEPDSEDVLILKDEIEDLKILNESIQYKNATELKNMKSQFESLLKKQENDFKEQLVGMKEEQEEEIQKRVVLALGQLKYDNTSNILSLEQIFELNKLTGFHCKCPLLYRASENDYDAHDFHKKCDNIDKTLVIIKTETGYIFGGFNPGKWNQVEGNEEGDFFDAKGAYLFGFYDINDSKKVIKLDYEENGKGICCHKDWGPIFGHAAIRVSDKCNENTQSYTWLDADRGFSSQGKGKNFLNGHAEDFIVSEYEVFQMK